jgi:hypothetical protein
MSSAEDLATWYLRLNGFLTISNFNLHPSRRGSQRTDADVVGVRFPFRREFSEDDFDDVKLGCDLSKPTLAITEVKTKDLDLNEAWQSSDKANINKVLADLGLFKSDEEINATAQGLYASGNYGEGAYYCTLLFVGNIDTGKIPTQYSSVPRILWKDVIEFIYRRFRKYIQIKTQHDQWDDLGKSLYQFAVTCNSLGDFEVQVRHHCFLPPVRQ